MVLGLFGTGKTRGLRVRVPTGMGTGPMKNTRGLPVLITMDEGQNVDDAILEKLIAGKLCLGIRKYVDSNNERDVANLTFISVDYHHIAPNNQFQWNENYQIAATSQGFSEGKVVDTTSTSIVDINYGETASLEGSDFTVASDPNAPPNGFLFNIGQTTSDVSAVLYINGIAGETNQSP
ncbi:hypothetical protein H0H93_010372, partial [Arthromyces matolae]